MPYKYNYHTRENVIYLVNFQLTKLHRQIEIVHQLGYAEFAIRSAVHHHLIEGVKSARSEVR